MKPSFQYETKLFVVHFGTDESPIDVYAMDHADLWATLKEQMPNLDAQDRTHSEDQHLATIPDTLH